MAHPELGRKILDRIADQVSEIAAVESAPRQDGRNMTMVLHPLKKQQPAGARHREPPAAAASVPDTAPAPPGPAVEETPAAAADATGAR
jgi:translation initiation factor IF-3